MKCKGPLLNKVQQPETLQEPFGLGSVRLNLPEVTWLVSWASVSDHFLFQCPKPM